MEPTNSSAVQRTTGENLPEAPSVAVGHISIRSTALTVVTVMGVVFLLRYAQELFIPVVLAILVSYALNPIVDLTSRLRVPRALAAGVVLLGITAAIGYGCYAVRAQAIEAIETLPEAAQKIRSKMAEFRGSQDTTSALGKIQQAAAEIEKTAAEVTSDSKPVPRGVTKVRIEEPVFRATDLFWTGSMGLFSFMSQVVLVWFLVYFILAAGDLFKRKFVRIIGTKLSEKRITLEAINEMNAQIGRFLLIQALTSVLVAVGTTAALWAYGLNQPAVWGIFAGILNSIPYVGAIVVSIGIALIAFLQFGTISDTVQISGIVLVITSLEGFLLTPSLMGKAARINGVAMFLGLLFWSWLWGIIGMIVAVPIMMALKTICERVDGLHAIGEMLDEKRVVASGV